MQIYSQRAPRPPRREIYCCMTTVLLTTLVFAMAACGGGDDAESRASATPDEVSVTPSQASVTPSQASVAPADCEPVETFENLGQDHLADGQSYDAYNSNPPTSGPHWPTPAEAGFYSESLPVEQLVHNLEHGQIVIYYNGLNEAELDALEEYTLEAEEAVVSVEAPEDFVTRITLTAWTKLQTCDGFSSEGVDAFRAQFQGVAPEQLTPPFGG